MLSFLKDYNQNLIYKRAMDCENQLHAFNCITPMAILAESELKDIYRKYNPHLDDVRIDRFKFIDLIQNNNFISFVIHNCHVTKDILDGLNDIRVASNEYKHDFNPREMDEEFVKKCFRNTFELSVGYYHFISGGKESLEWDEEEYKKLRNKALTDDEKKQYSEEINRLKGLVKEERKKQDDLNLKIDSLESDIHQMQMDPGQYETVDKLKLNELYEKISELEGNINQKESQIHVLEEEKREALIAKNRSEADLKRVGQFISTDGYVIDEKQEYQSDDFEKNRIELNKKLEKLSAINKNLQRELDSSIEEKTNLQTKLEIIIKNNGSSERCQKLKKELFDTRAEKEQSENRISNVQEELNFCQSKLYTATSKSEELFEEYLNRRDKAEEFLSLHAPQCPDCGEKMDYKINKKNGQPFWGCKNYYRTKCTGTLSLQPNILEQYREILGNKVEYKLPAINSSRSNDYFPYPECTVDSGFDTSYFQSIAVPEEVFSNREKLDVEKFSQFQVSTNLKKRKVESIDRLIYSLCLRVLNRGEVLPVYKRTDEVLRRKFNQKNFGDGNKLFEYISYDHPVYAYDSERERIFAERYLAPILGNQWATFVSSQIEINSIIDNENPKLYHQRVDFLICINRKKIVVEIDGPSHNNTRDNDNYRDEVLEGYDFIVKRYKNSDIDQLNKNVFDDLEETIGQNINNRKPVEIDDRYLVSCKLAHQFAVAIVKCLEQGYIGKHANIRAYASTEMFSESEIQYIFSVAATEVYALLYSFGDIYEDRDCPSKIPLWNCDFFDANESITRIEVGDGNFKDGSSIFIRDCVIPSKYRCKIEEYEMILPMSDVREDTLEFFLMYLFGYEHFRPGQVSAIRKFLKAEDSIVLLPTGSGKSIIYQIVSFLVPGIVVVISPLISLIEDQKLNLQERNGITNVVMFSSKESRENNTKNRHLMQHNSTSLIYIAPERMQIPTFRREVENLMLKNNIFGVSIDEAHCVSEWGHDFRPAYLNIGNASRRLFRKHDFIPVIMALTGTASDAVLNDVRSDLNIYASDALIMPNSFARPELHFSVRSCAAKDKAYHIADIVKNELPDKFGMEYSHFSKLDGEATNAGIVFTPYAKRLNSMYSARNIRVELRKLLPELGIGNYFSQKPDEYETESWNATIRDFANKFKNNELNLLVATKAFGMGIDKPNVRFIIHDGIPSSFEQYYQEAGRAGRDKQNAECILLFSNDNEEINERILSNSLSFDEFEAEYNEYKTDVYKKQSSDDISALLYFHHSAFKGFQKEIDVAAEILILMEHEGFEKNRTISIPISVNTKNFEEKRKNWEKAIVRLVKLGVVNDYTYDYGKRKFTLECGSIEKNDIAERYSKYVSGSIKDPNRIKREKLLIEQNKQSGKALVLDAVEIMIKYIYDYIEKSRRRAIYEMYDAAKMAAQLKGEEQNKYLKKRITSYFTYSGENYNVLAMIENSEHAGLKVVLKELQLVGREAYVFTKEEQENAEKISVLAGRFLESKPDHPGMLLAQAMSRLILGDSKSGVVKNDIILALEYAKERYLVEREILFDTSVQVLRFIVHRSFDLFESVLGIAESVSEDLKHEILYKLITLNQIDDEYRMYVLSHYAKLRLKEWEETDNEGV